MYKSKDFNPKPQKWVYVSPHGLRSFCHLWLYGPNLDTVIIPGSHSGLTCDPGQVSHCHRAVISFLSELLPHFFLSPARPVVPVISHHHQTRWLSPGMNSTGAGFPGRAHELCVPWSIPSTGWHWAGVQDATPYLHGSCLPIKQSFLHLCQSFFCFVFFFNCDSLSTNTVLIRGEHWGRITMVHLEIPLLWSLVLFRADATTTAKTQLLNNIMHDLIVLFCFLKILPGDILNFNPCDS